MGIYLDYNASAPIDSEVLKTMINIYRNHIGNADSRTHPYGDSAREIVESARKQVAELLNVTPGEVFFTSGATESNNIAIQGLFNYACESGKKHIVTSTIEHKAILETVKEMERRGLEVDFVDPDTSGRIDPEKVFQRIQENTLLVSIMHVNNETGIIQPIHEIGEELATRNILFHIDATQSCGKLVKELQTAKYSMLSFSAHKLEGPQGIGVLVLRKKNYKLPPVKSIMFGGQQEHGIRPGTVPVALVAGCGKACEIALNSYEENSKKLKNIKELILKLLIESGVSYSLNGDQSNCLDNTINICFHGVSSEALMLSSKQYCSVSNGSACTSSNYAPSYVLSAMGIPINQIESSIRVSWGPKTNIDKLTEGMTQLLAIVKSLAP